MRINPSSLGIAARRLALPFCAASVISCGGGSDAPPATAPVVPSPPPAEGSFSTAAALVMPRAGHTATLLPNGKVLLVGGSPSWPPTAAVATSAELYDPATNTFSATGSLAFARRGGHAATLLSDGRVMATIIAVGKIAISIISSYAVVYFRFPFRMAAFWLIFMTLMLPVEVRIYPTYKIAADLKLLDSYAGLTIPLIASATATLFFRQFFMTIPDELIEASKLDGAGPFRFFKDTVLPLSKTNIAALFVILFIYGWNQYLWPLLITTRDDMQTIVIGIKKMIVTADALTEWNVVMATAMLAMLPPVAVVILMQRWFVKGLVETEK